MVSIRPEEQNGVSQLRYVKYDSDTMADIDTEQERKRLQRVYSGMTEGELRALAEDAVSLTPDAVQALSADLARRELDIAVSTSDDESGVPPEELVTIRSFRGIPEAMLPRECLIRPVSNALWSTTIQAVCLAQIPLVGSGCK